LFSHHGVFNVLYRILDLLIFKRPRLGRVALVFGLNKATELSALTESLA
jgi:hypothetical protein